MIRTPNSFVPSLFSKKAPGGLATSGDIKKSVAWVAGYLLTSCIPRRADSRAYELFRSSAVAHVLERQLLLDSVRERMHRVLGKFKTPGELKASSGEYLEMKMEDLWARWHASHGPDRFVRTELDGLGYWVEAMTRGNGVVFWGTSFCGTLLPKIAMWRSGICPTQLSTADHGAHCPLTLLGRYVVGPLCCHQEARYLKERIRIPVDESDGSGYKERMREVLSENGSLWITGERLRSARPIVAELLGRQARFPPGAPALALRTGATLLPVHTRRQGRFHYRFTIQAPIRLQANGDTRVCLSQATQEYANRLSSMILEHPGDWDWGMPWVESLITQL